MSKVIGTGSLEDPYRPELRDHATAQGVSVSSVIPTDANGIPTAAFALCVVNAPDHTVFDGLVDTDRFPDITLDSKVSVLKTAQRNELENFLSKRGINTSKIGINTTFGEVVRTAGKHLDPNFELLGFDAK